MPDGNSSGSPPPLAVFSNTLAIFLYMLGKCSPVCHQWSRTGTLKTFLDHSRVSTSHRSPATNIVLNLNIRESMNSNYSLKMILNNLILILLNIVESNHINSTKENSHIITISYYRMVRRIICFDPNVIKWTSQHRRKVLPKNLQLQLLSFEKSN